MAELTGTLSPGDIDVVFSRTAIGLGTRIKDTSGNEFIFLRGCASTVVGSWVTYDETWDTTLLAANAKGPVAIACAITVAGKYGWYQIYGHAKGNITATTSDNTVGGYETTSGYWGDGMAAGDIVYGAFCRSAEDDGSGATEFDFQICYPWVDDLTGGH